MNRDDALKKSDEALKELAAALQAGKSETLIQYLDLVGRFHQYSFGNCMLICLQRPDATMVAGFNRWKDLHRWVKKGEKGIAILAPLIRKRKSDESQTTPAHRGSNTDDSKKNNNDKVLIGFRVVHVYDVSQTDGKELPEFAKLGGDPSDLQPSLEELVASHGIEMEYVDGLGGAHGVSLKGKIQVLESLHPAQKFSTTVHELAHELLHRGDRRAETSKTVRETEAEAVAYVVCRWAGVDCSTHASDYIQLYSGDETVLMQSLELIREVSAKIISALDASRQQQAEVALEEVSNG